MTTRRRPPRQGPAGWLARVAVALACWLPSAARAQAPVVSQDRGATDGVDRPYKDLSGAGDASSLELNPALLAAVRGLDLTIRGYRAIDDFARGTGFGAFLSTNLGFGLATALGVQTIRPAFGGGRVDPLAGEHPPLTKISLGMAGGDGRRGAFGVALHGVRDAEGWLAPPDLDAGALLRITNFASLGSQLRWSRGGGRLSLPQELRWAAELAIRPLGQHWLELAGGISGRLRASADDTLESARRDFGGADLRPRGRAAVRWQGWTLHGEVEQIDVRLHDPLTLAPLARGTTIRGSVALEVAWDFARVGAGIHAGLGDAVDGVGVMAEFSTTRQGRIYWPRQVDIERLELARVSDQRDLIAMLQRIAQAERAGRRAVLLVDARGVGVGWAGLWELRQALIRVRDAGGHVFAYLESASTRDYYVASAAERIYLHPAGELRLIGVQATSFYFKDALAKLGLVVEADRMAEYKSAHEPFTRSGRSEADREQQSALLDTVDRELVREITRARELDDPTVVRAVIDRAPLGPAEALEARLVDELSFRDELTDKLSEQLGAQVRFASFTDTAPEQQRWASEPYFAIVLVEGTIVEGKGGTIPFLDLRNAGSDPLIQTLRSLRKDRACKGIVLRVDSPGGSALASDLIWREVELTRLARERDGRSPPIVVSMSDVAASGGYYVAMGARKIYAAPTTITGSIGVVSLRFDASELLRKLGIAVDTIQRGENATTDQPWAPRTDRERERSRASIERTYELFLGRVADARPLTLDEVRVRARGRVWSGEDALAQGLVDELGDLRAAIGELGALAGIRDPHQLPLRVLPRRPRLLDLILDSARPDLSVKVAKARQQRRRPPIPPALDRALARLPLMVLLLDRGEPATLLDPVLELR